MKFTCLVLMIALLCALLFPGCRNESRVVQRPERIVSMREVVYDKTTYVSLAELWKEYYEAYPSEDAYANWTYAARYAGLADYTSLLETGVTRYPANPTLLYLQSMVHHGAPGDLRAQALLERAAELDPSFVDPWFSLVVHYLERGDREKLNVALRRLLDTGAIADEVMDFSYNMLACMDEGGILVTNGDNDTYPGWILTRLIGYRPDVRIVNRSLLNTEWYPLVLLNEGIPAFISVASLDSLRAGILQGLKESQSPVPPGGPFSDPLIERLVIACTNARRPVYFSPTLQQTDGVRRIRSSGRDLGLVTLVTPPADTDRLQLRRVLRVWLEDFRTAGLDGWGVRYARAARAGKMLVRNYGAALHLQMGRILEHAPDYRLELFRWYRDHLPRVLPDEDGEELNRMWCRSDDIGEIREWCRSQNLGD